MTYKAQKIKWTPEAITRHNIPTDAATFIAQARKGQNSDSDETLCAHHAKLMEIRNTSVSPAAIADKIQAALSIFKTNYPELCGKGFKFGFRVSATNSNIVEVATGGTPYCTVNTRSGKVSGI